MTESPSVKIPGESRHFPELDGIRGLAISMVLIAHGVDFLRIVPGKGEPGFSTWGKLALQVGLQGWGGVDLFFTLSGFLITGILLRARSKPNYFSSFYARRALRIFPIYYFALVAFLLVAHVSGTVASRLPVGPHGVASYFFYLQNWPCFWQSWAGLTGLWGVYWSLAVEEQFYMVWPTVVRFVPLRAILLICIAGFAAGWPVRLFLVHHHGLFIGVMQSPFSRLDGLFLGAAIALYREIYGRAVPMRWAVASLLVGCALILYVVLIHPDELFGSGSHIWSAGVTAFALIAGGMVAASHYRPPVLHRILTTRWLLFSGRISYGMYVYHLAVYTVVSHEWVVLLKRYDLSLSPLRAAVVLAIAIAAVTVVSALSFRFFETPFLRLKRFFPSPAAPV